MFYLVHDKWQLFRCVCVTLVYTSIFCSYTPIFCVGPFHVMQLKISQKQALLFVSDIWVHWSSLDISSMFLLSYLSSKLFVTRRIQGTAFVHHIKVKNWISINLTDKSIPSYYPFDISSYYTFDTSDRFTIIYLVDYIVLDTVNWSL